MNQKIPFHELSARIATTTGISEESAEQFVKNFFDLIFESLIRGECVKVKGLGAFNLIDINGEKSIEFLADKDITDVINAPFAMFEPVKLNASVSEEMLTQAYSNTEIEETHVSIQDESVQDESVSDFPSASDVEEIIDGQSATNVSSTTPRP
ncbi:MAG: HU family DNA-binding protein, partial [Duncaniella dubosii]|nr:HU family DNA-binding protein [Duncaniella dubosii]